MHFLPASSIMTNNFVSDHVLLLQAPIQAQARYQILTYACYPVEWEAGLSDLPSGWMKYDSMLRFGEGHSRVTEAAGSHFDRNVTWLITDVVDGITLLHKPLVWTCVFEWRRSQHDIA